MGKQSLISLWAAMPHAPVPSTRTSMRMRISMGGITSVTPAKIGRVRLASASAEASKHDGAQAKHLGMPYSNRTCSHAPTSSNVPKNV